ncbi:DUF1289 domain-containing protein [Variovorax sp. PCZ-1]|uniref:DUF1289 domain-containing protein n=1 Tax=Variovorax sp. PCZ-1 TaxID=2835533 RepID=UPI001BCFDFD5|nr:DUF1289 domain-containing protein [Variovorax sp. PCZ-1]MBS7808277.1 DUF1289 domain-containing protein [Variovorax sp. PCZ-1]
MSTPSPCISVCQMDKTTGWCKGCYRTIEEIIAWGQGSEALKTSVWQALPARHRQADFLEAHLNRALMDACGNASAKESV